MKDTLMKKLQLTLTMTLVLSSLLISCSENHFKKDKTFAGSKLVSKETLNLGKTSYAEYCIQCHGVNGDGKGPASKGLIPPPRDFTQGLYKFGEVVAGDLPHDAHLAKIIRKGLHGTAMLPWDISDIRLNAVVQYIKTFAPEVWEAKDAQLGAAVTLTKDPYGAAHREFAINKGKEVYHGVADCYSCHRAYLGKKEIGAVYKKVNGESMDLSDLDETTYELKAQETEYGYKALPPDFTFHPLRSIHNGVNDLYIRISSGVNGSGMPSWRETIEDDQIWAVAYYIDYLMGLRDTPAREELIKAAK